MNWDYFIAFILIVGWNGYLLYQMKKNNGKQR